MTHLDYLNQSYPMRKSKRQKDDFKKYIISLLSEKGITARVEKTRKGKNENIVIGSSENAKIVCTAHYDTPATSIAPNLMLPRNVILLYLFHFLPIIAILALSLIPALLISEFTNQPLFYPIIFLTLYFGLFFFLYLAFTNKNNYNDNTSGVAVILELIDKLSKEELEKVAFILFDNEEKGKLGSKAYFSDHKEAMKEKLVINFDCVGNGDNILFIAMKNAEKKEEYRLFKKSFKGNEKYTVSYFPARSSAGNSDHKSFPNGVCCMACKKTRRGILYTSKIHTNKDTIVSCDNIEFITDGMTAYIENLV